LNLPVEREDLLLHSYAMVLLSEMMVELGLGSEGEGELEGWSQGSGRESRGGRRRGEGGGHGLQREEGERKVSFERESEGGEEERTYEVYIDLSS